MVRGRLTPLLVPRLTPLVAAVPAAVLTCWPRCPAAEAEAMQAAQETFDFAALAAMLDGP